MRLWSVYRLARKVALLAAVLGLTAPVVAQSPVSVPHAPPQSCPTAPPLMPYPSITPTPSTGETPTTPTPATPSTAEAPETAGAAPTATAGAGYGGQSAVGYIDPAIPQTMFRLRFDAAFDSNRADRAEYFYGAWRELSFHTHTVNHSGSFFDANARGPDQFSDHLNYQELTAYLEWALSERFSVFGDVPWRFVHFNDVQEDDIPTGPHPPEPHASENENPRENGISDIRLGFKYAFVAEPDQRYLTLQFRAYIPTGDARLGLGTGHVSLEPGLLFFQRLSDRMVLEGEILDWNPVGGTAEAGNVLQYGLGLQYTAYHQGNLSIVPVAELVGWTVLYGFESFIGPAGTFVSTEPPAVAATLPTNHGVEDASGATILNAKLGVRTYFGNGNDVYVGWGHCVTGSRWYEDIFRIEYRRTF